MVNAVGAELNSVDGWVSVGARHRDIDIAASDPGGETAERHFDGGAVIGVGHQPVGQLMRATVGGPGPADAKVGESRPAQVLDDGERSGAQNFQGCHGYLLS